MDNQLWSWILGAVGIVGFILSGRKVWWSWYVNLGCQALWFAYAIVTTQYGFIVTALAYTYVFGKNASMWTREHRAMQEPNMSSPRVYMEAVRSGEENVTHDNRFGIYYTHISHIMMVDPKSHIGQCINCGGTTDEQENPKLGRPCFLPDPRDRLI